jgi:hemoglobin-like flavoprotein
MGLGERHAGYGVQPHHYTLVKEVLLWACEQALGDAFTPDVRAAWSCAYGELAHAMQAQQAHEQYSPAKFHLGRHARCERHAAGFR